MDGLTAVLIILLLLIPSVLMTFERLMGQEFKRGYGHFHFEAFTSTYTFTVVYRKGIYYKIDIASPDSTM